ncbi:MAG: hypothetical protein DRP71_11900 [Verrucomicrobia bacterium]|nr:MAG: hypothetical protein DRP71_11900 [Verrucomicrobiota bacterium]
MGSFSHLLCAALILMVAIASWFFGRMGPALVLNLSVFGAAVLLILISHEIKTRRIKGVSRNRTFPLTGFLPWLFFLGLGVVGLFNPAYTRILLPEGPALVRQAHSETLPMVVNANHAIIVLILYAVGMVAFVAIVRSAFSRSLLRSLLVLLVVNGALISAIGLLGKLTSGFSLFGLLPQTDTLPFATFDYHNNWTGFAVPLIAVALGLIEYRMVRQIRDGQSLRLPPGLAFCVLLLVLGVVMSSSRSGLLLMAVVFAIALFRLARVVRRMGSKGVSWSRLLRPNTLYVMVLLIAFGALLFAGRGILKARWDYTRMQVEQVSERGRVESRVYLARDTASMAMDKPILGWGNGSWAYVFPLFAGPEFSLRMGASMRSFPFAHNDWLQLWAETGLIGFLAVMSVPIGILLLLRRKGRANPVTDWTLCGIALVGVLACWDYPMGHPANLLQVSVLSGLAVAYAILDKRVRKERHGKG